MNGVGPSDDMRDRSEENADRLAFRSFAVMALAAFLCAAFSPVAGGLSGLVLSVAAAVSGALCVAAFHPASVLISFALAYPLAFLLTGSPLTALIVFLPLPVAAFIGISARKKKTCAYAVVGSSVVITALFALFAAVFVYGLKGSFDRGALIGVVNDAYEALSGYVRSVYEYAAQQAGTSVSLTEESVSEFARYMIATIPAAFVVAAEVISFICAKLLAVMCGIFGKEKILCDPKWKFDMSLISASIFVICTVGAFILSLTDADAVHFAFSDIQLILTPGLALIGFRAVFGRFRRGGRPSAVKIVLIVIACVLFFWALISIVSALVSLFAIVGALSVIKRKAPRPKPME